MDEEIVKDWITRIAIITVALHWLFIICDRIVRTKKENRKLKKRKEALNIKCPECGSYNINIDHMFSGGNAFCRDCGFFPI
jgi:predicted RNA-binding Zn-ribbon protein involved in translation (DUF1610 family)